MFQKRGQVLKCQLADILKSQKHIRFEKRFENVCFKNVAQCSNVVW